MVEKFLMKKGQVINAIASDFLKKSVGDKVSSISEYQEELEVARGTVQNAISYLKNEGAFKLISKGHQGSFISEINYEILQSYALSETVLGTMTLPYSKLYEGLATGIYEEFRNNHIPLNLGYIRGSKERIKAVTSKFYRFAIVSKFAAKQAIHNREPLEIALDFGKNSYLSEHVVVFSSENTDKTIEKKKVAIDYNSIDQYLLTEEVVKGKNVQLVEMPGFQILTALRKGIVDVGVWNLDELMDKDYSDLSYSKLKHNKWIDDMTSAVVVVHKDDDSLRAFFNQSVVADKIIEIQNKVKNNEMIPQY